MMDQKTEAKLKELAGDTRNRFAWAAKLALDRGERIQELEAEVARLKPYAPAFTVDPAGQTGGPTLEDLPPGVVEPGELEIEVHHDPEPDEPTEPTT